MGGMPFLSPKVLKGQLSTPGYHKTMARYLCKVVTQELSDKIQILLAHLWQKYTTQSEFCHGNKTLINYLTILCFHLTKHQRDLSSYWFQHMEQPASRHQICTGRSMKRFRFTIHLTY